MKTDIMHQPAFAVCVAELDAGEQLRVEGGAMVAMSGVSVETQATGGFFKSLRRSVLGGESFFQNVYTADTSGAKLYLAPALAGDIMTMELRDRDLILQSGSYIASTMGIEIDSSWGGAKSFFGGEGLFMLRCTGSGTLIAGTYGAIHTVSLDAGERFTVDSGHVVAFDHGMSFEVHKFGNWKSTIAGGEGFVVELTGPGNVHLQTRSQSAFLGWLIPNLPSDRDTN